MQTDIRTVEIHPINRAIRGRIANKTPLRESLCTQGQQNEIVCIPNEDVKGGYLAIDGGSRLEAAREAGAKFVDIAVRAPMTDDEVRQYILSTAVRFPFPELILQDGEPVGGMCVAIVQELNSGRPKLDICRAYNLSPDVVSAYAYLYKDIPEMQQAVASGRLSMTVYSRIKRKPKEFKQALADQDGDLSYEKVRQAKNEAEGKTENVCVAAAMSVRNTVWGMSARPVDEAAREFLIEARELIDQLLAGGGE